MPLPCCLAIQVLGRLTGSFQSSLSLKLDQTRRPAFLSMHNSQTLYAIWGSRHFFRLYNPNLPLFSETSFYLHSRSEPLKLAIIRTGLQCLENSQFKVSLLKQLDERLEAINLLKLPHNLDTLQYLSLLCFGVSSFVHKRMSSIVAIMISLLTSLGLHANLSTHPHSVERRHAFYVASLCIYNMSPNAAHLDIPSSLALSDLKKDSSIYHLCSSLRYPEPSHTQDIPQAIHFITLICLLQFALLCTYISRQLILAQKLKTPGCQFALSVESVDRKLQSLFKWGWKQLVQLRDTNTEHTALKHTSRIILALNYHINRIKLMKVASHIPLDLKAPLCLSETTDVITPASIRGFASSLTVLHLLKQFPPVPGAQSR
ncbi:hypothetical protein DSO57_1029436 [Entomophthora muscae]|uniref:Uncharacterized protein n=1 Tax=Entomophthora muscae TaxID=34485 RepID=A0ACC2RFW3_9FUNG|nr:hypothetical protein DSO57_1029436 [Entomophthora muscae]